MGDGMSGLTSNVKEAKASWRREAVKRLAKTCRERASVTDHDHDIDFLTARARMKTIGQ
jgi:hypothetical protein